MDIVCLGDSITYGDGVPDAVNWVSLLTARAVREGVKVRVRNAGVNGETARDGLRRLPGLLSPAPADVLYVQFGLNDAWSGVFSQEDYVAYMDKIVRYAQHRHCGRILIGANHTVCVTPEQEMYGGKEYKEQIRRFNAALRRAFALQHSGAAFVDIEAACDAVSLHERAAFLQMDGVHVSEAGYRFYCELLYPLIMCVGEGQS